MGYKTVRPVLVYAVCMYRVTAGLHHKWLRVWLGQGESLKTVQHTPFCVLFYLGSEREWMCCLESLPVFCRYTSTCRYLDCIHTLINALCLGHVTELCDELKSVSGQ